MKLSTGKIILFLLHGALLFPILFEESTPFPIAIAACVFTILLFTFIGNLKSQEERMDISSFVPFLVLVGGISTYYLSIEMKLGAIIAASLIGFLASFIPSFIKSPLSKSAPAAIYCGSFVGMCSPMIAPNYTFVALASLFSGGVFLLVKNDLNGIGGKLGTIAFSGVILLTLLIQLLK